MIVRLERKQRSRLALFYYESESVGHDEVNSNPSQLVCLAKQISTSLSTPPGSHVKGAGMLVVSFNLVSRALSFRGVNSFSATRLRSSVITKYRYTIQQELHLLPEFKFYTYCNPYRHIAWRIIKRFLNKIDTEFITNASGSATFFRLAREVCGEKTGHRRERRKYNRGWIS